jgi:NADH:ubiquinone oxidoreductase subunit 3 (subunit A)
MKKTRLESRKLERELMEAPAGAAYEAHDEAHQTPAFVQRVGVQLPGLIMRFIVFEVALVFWGLLAGFFNSVGSAAINALAARGYQPATTFGYALLSFLSLSGTVFVFLTLGWPLLKDVTGLLGFEPRDVMRGRLRRLSKRA